MGRRLDIDDEIVLRLLVSRCDAYQMLGAIWPAARRGLRHERRAADTRWGSIGALDPALRWSASAVYSRTE